MRRTIVLLGVGILGVLFVISVLVSNKQREAVLTLNFKNIDKVLVYQIDEGEAGTDNNEGEEEPLFEVTTSGDKISLATNKQYLLSYKGVSGYEDGEKVVQITDNKTINLDPYYSKEKLGQILASELPVIQRQIKESYPNVYLYSIQPGELYRKGDWYGTTLLYTGPYTPNRDSLRLIMNKNNGKWVIMTNPPNISLNKYEFPNIPVEILDEVNDQGVPKPKIM